MNPTELIEKLQAVRKSVRSKSSQLLLDECIKELKLEEQERIAAAVKEFHVTQRVKFDEAALNANGIALSPTGKAQRFLVNTIDKVEKRVYVVDAAGKEQPRWVGIDMIMPAED